MRRKIEITTSAFEKPYVTDCMYEDSPSALKIRWKQKHEGDKADSVYDIEMDKNSGVARIRRKGEIRSVLEFDTSVKSKGVFITPYGEMTIDIRTNYINMPSLLANRFEIDYEICYDDGHKEKNIFCIKLL